MLLHKISNNITVLVFKNNKKKSISSVLFHYVFVSPHLDHGYAGEVAVTAELGVGELFMEQREEFVEHLYLFGRTVIFPRTHRVEAVRTLAALATAEGAGIGHTVLSVGTTWVMPQSALFLASAFVADADAPGIVLRGVAALDADGATVVERAVTPHVQVENFMNFAEFYREPPHIAELCSSRPSRMSYLCTVIQPCLPFSPIEVIYSWCHDRHRSPITDK